MRAKKSLSILDPKKEVLRFFAFIFFLATILFQNIKMYFFHNFFLFFSTITFFQFKFKHGRLNNVIYNFGPLFFLNKICSFRQSFSLQISSFLHILVPLQDGLTIKRAEVMPKHKCSKMFCVLLENSNLGAKLSFLETLRTLITPTCPG